METSQEDSNKFIQEAMRIINQAQRQKLIMRLMRGFDKTRIGNTERAATNTLAIFAGFGV